MAQADKESKEASFKLQIINKMPEAKYIEKSKVFMSKACAFFL